MNMKSKICVFLSVLMLLGCLPTTALAQDEGSKEAEAILVLNVEALGKVYHTEGKSGRFGFSAGPRTNMTRHWLDRQGREAVVLYTFTREKDYQAALDMILDCGLSWRGSVAYPNSVLPSTWFGRETSISVLRYEGTDEAVLRELQRQGYRVLGGYFASYAPGRGYPFREEELNNPDSVWNHALDKSLVEQPDTKLADLLAESPMVCVARVKKVPAWEKSMTIREYRDKQERWRYEIEILENIRNCPGKTMKLRDLDPGVLEEGRTYVLFLQKQEDGGVTLNWIAEDNPAALEVDDRGYVLPARKLGMNRLVSLENYIRTLKGM